MSPQTTEIDGHTYKTAAFGFDDAVDIGLRIVSILSGPVGQAIDAATKQINADKLLESSVDLGAIGSALGGVPERILAQGGPAFLRRILSRTSRGYRDASGKEIMMALSDTHVLDQAYAGNLREMLKAVSWVLKVNYGPLAPQVGMTGLQGLLGSLSGWLGGLGGGTEKTSTPVAAAG
jgi:hypothetical protein